MDLLVADASPIVRRMIRTVLGRAGVAGIVEADTGRLALHLLGRQAAGVVIVGANLDDMTGTELAAQIRNMPQQRRTPLLMVSDRRSPEDVLEAVDAGVDHYILIPFPEELLVEKVQKSLEKAAQVAATPRTQIQRLYVHRG